MPDSLEASPKKHRPNIKWERTTVSVHVTIALAFRQLYPHCRILRPTSRSQTSDENEANENLQSVDSDD